MTQWERDPRAGADRHTILNRMAAGMGAEEAISTPCRPQREGLIEAFGEAKSAPEWALDARCTVGDAQINMRLRKGLTPEEAITRPNRFAARLAEATEEPVPEGRGGKCAHTRYVRAWGEAKSMNEWTKDARCRVSLSVLMRRLREGMDAEAAIATPSSFRWEGGLSAFGETRTLLAWSEDPRCPVTLTTLVRRLDAGMAPEEAIRRPSRHPAREAQAAIRPKGVPSHANMVTAFGETKTLAGWAKDARCPVLALTIGKRLREGMGAEAAITTPDGAPDVMVTAFGETKNVMAWAADPRCTVGNTGLKFRLERGMSPEAAITTPARKMGRTNLLRAFGEARSLREWTEDPRCRVSYQTLWGRIYDGMDAETAISTPPQEVRRTAYGETVEAFGERRTLAEWLEDGRAAASRDTVVERYRQGWPLEEALTTPPGGRATAVTLGMQIEAFGDRMNLSAWARDARCVVGEETLRDRLKAGWEPARALATRASTPQDRKGISTPHVPERSMTAFGETKGMGAWARDGRCAVRLPTLRDRVKKGWRPEDALTVATGVAFDPLARAA